MLSFLFLFFFFFLDKISVCNSEMASNSRCSPGYPWTHCVVQLVLENVLGSQVSLELTILLAQPFKFEP